jgi:hypothetical protein
LNFSGNFTTHFQWRMQIHLQLHRPDTIKKPTTSAGFSFLAESKRFELLIQFPIYTLSRRAPSTTRTTLQFPKGCKSTILFHSFHQSEKNHLMAKMISLTFKMMNRKGMIKYHSGNYHEQIILLSLYHITQPPD